jgi:hypothetical protein
MKAALGLLLGLFLLLAGCVPGPGPGAPVIYEAEPGITTVPPAWYDYDPNMAKWYQPPYFNPYYPNF